MYIENLTISNFRSLKSISLNLNHLTILCGANASGKSTILSALKFIHDIAARGIDEAIMLQGGISNLLNSQVTYTEPLELKFFVDCSSHSWFRTIDKEQFSIKMKNFEYIMKLSISNKYKYVIDYDKLIFNWDCFDTKDNDMDYKNPKPDFAYSVTISKDSESKISEKTFSYSFGKLEEGNDRLKEIADGIQNDFSYDMLDRFIFESPNESLLNKLDYFMPPFYLRNEFLKIYDFNSKAIKSCSPTETSKYLLPDGSNTSTVLQRILDDDKNYDKLIKLLKRFLPYVDDIEAVNRNDGSYSFSVKEKFSKSAFLADYLSDGTVALIALIIALYFEKDSRIIVLEEPERNIYPKLLNNLLNFATESSANKQIIITTHNRDIVASSNVEDIRFVYRTDEGNSVVSNPSTNKRIAQYLESENYSIEDLFLNDMLGD